MLFVLTAFGQSDSIFVEKKLKEVMISATKTSQTINQLPLPVVIISEKEIRKENKSLKKGELTSMLSSRFAICKKLNT